MPCTFQVLHSFSHNKFLVLGRQFRPILGVKICQTFTAYVQGTPTRKIVLEGTKGTSNFWWNFWVTKSPPPNVFSLSQHGSHGSNSRCSGSQTTGVMGSQPRTKFKILHPGRLTWFTWDLEDHPMTCKWLISMVSKSPKDRVGSLPNGRFMADKWGWS